MATRSTTFNAYSFLLFMLIPVIGFGQTGNQDVIVVRVTVPFVPADIEFVKDQAQIFSAPAFHGKVRIRNLKTGYYMLRLIGLGDAKLIADSVLVKEGQSIELQINMDEPCIFDHTADWMPVCPERHTDHILPIVYGLLSRRHRRDSTTITSFAGGCVVTGCDPQYYCAIHKIRF